MKSFYILLILSSITVTAFAQTSTTRFPDSPKMRTLGPLGQKVDAKIVTALNTARTKNQTTSSAALELKKQLNGSLLPTTKPETFIVQIDCSATTAVVNQIKRTGANVINVIPKWNSISAEATLDQIQAMSNIPGIKFIKLETGAGVGTSGQADNHADIDMKADLLRIDSSLSGLGQTVGVLSDTCNRTAAVGAGVISGLVPNSFLSNTNNQISGDLPPQYQVVDYGPNSGSDEGSGMMELVYDICPQANIAFASAFTGGQTGFAQNITKLRTEANCTVICDDVFYFEEPFFQDGPIAQSIEDCVTSGIPYFTLAGNHANGGIQSSFQDIDPSSPGNSGSFGTNFHNWGIVSSTTSFLPITLSNGTTFRATLQWNQPWSSYNLGNGSESDLDIYLYDGTTTASSVLTSSLDPQGSVGNPAGNPSEFIQYQNTSGASKTVYLAVDLFGGKTTNEMRLVFLSNGANYEYPFGGVNGPTIYGHMATKNAITVGAIFTGDIQTNGAYGPDFTAINAESFSSKGGQGANGIPIYFTTTGTLIAGGPELRNKPDIAAPDGTNTRFFGSDSSFDADSFPNFFGTSAATPNAAAVGALLREKNPLLTPAEIKSILTSTAQDIVAAAPLSVAGPDDYTGAGLVNAQAAGATVTNVKDWNLY